MLRGDYTGIGTWRIFFAINNFLVLRVVSFSAIWREE